MAQWRSAPPVRMSGQTKSSRISSGPPVHGQRVAGARRSAGRGGRRGSRRPRRSHRRARSRRPPAAPRGGPAARRPRRAASRARAARAAQCRSSPQPKRSSGNGSSSAARGAPKAVTRPDLHEARLARQRQRPAPGHPPGRVAAQGLGGLGEVEREALAERHEAVEEARRQAHVVVDDQRPVARRRRPAPSSRLRFSNFPPLEPPRQRVRPPAPAPARPVAPKASRTSWRSERSAPSAAGQQRAGPVDAQPRARAAAPARRRGGPAAAP